MDTESGCVGSDEAPYFRYWGKAAATGDGPECHLLPYHALDVAAIGERLLHRRADWTRRIADQLGIRPSDLTSWVVYSLALHDLGKFARSFQGLAQPSGCRLVPPVAGMRYRPQERHDALGARLWSEVLVERIPAVTREEPGGAVDWEVEEALELWLGCFFGHHGKPVAGSSHPLLRSFLPDDQEAALQFVLDAAEVVTPSWPLARLRDAEWRTAVLAPMTWQLAGLAVLADWLGSNAGCFPYRDTAMPLADYWLRHARPGADAALAATGLVEPPVATGFPGFYAAFGLEPTPLQTWAETTSLRPGPQLFLLEDITGAGKTEAAMTLAHRLIAEGRARGMYVGLPTMATSNAMYRRLGRQYRQLYAKDSTPSLVLAHGARHLDEAFTGSVVPEPNLDRPYQGDEPTAGISCRAWLADNRKKALLADVGVGTIDQALLGILPRKHQSLRLLGLADKVLVVDEVHAYDTYTATLLKTLLQTHAHNGGSAVLLSATLPHAMRIELLDAWQHGRGIEPRKSAEGEGFPLAAKLHDGGLEESPVSPGPANGRRLPVAFIHDAETAIDTLVAAAAAGRCACWIRNTVDDALDSYQQLRQRLPDPGKATLFHARFTVADRQRIEEEVVQCFGKGSGAEARRGRILVATQVVEQSLDLDFDLLITDLAPIELLIQRAGRLHRHRRDGAGNLCAHADQRLPPVLRVLAPAWQDDPPEDWVRGSLPGTSYIYSDPVVLWRTCEILRDEGAIRLPERARALLEAVYGESRTVPERLQQAHDESWATDRTAASGARFNAIRPREGYRHGGDGAGWDDDQELGTRLSNERTIPVILIREDGGRPTPWHAGQAHAWAMSTVNLRESQARRLPQPPSALTAAIAALQDAQPGLRAARFWLPEEGAETAYDPRLGAMIPR